MSYLDPEAEAGYCIEQIRKRLPPGAPVSRYGMVAVYPRPTGWYGQPVMRDPRLPHQIVIEHGKSGGIAISCNCRYTSRGGGFYEPIETRPRWGDGEALRVWREFHAP